jgi:hypothetical protein
MGKPYLEDLRVRVIEAGDGGASRRGAVCGEREFSDPVGGAVCADRQRRCKAERGQQLAVGAACVLGLIEKQPDCVACLGP